jgi:hypothetical protein
MAVSSGMANSESDSKSRFLFSLLRFFFLFRDKKEKRNEETAVDRHLPWPIITLSKPTVLRGITKREVCSSLCRKFFLQ